MRHRWGIFALLESKRYLRNAHTLLGPFVVALWIAVIASTAAPQLSAQAIDATTLNYAILWLCAGLSFLLGADRLFQADHQNGLLEQLFLVPAYFILLMRIALFALLHGLFFCLVCLPILWLLLGAQGNLLLFVLCLLLALPALCMTVALGAAINLISTTGGFAQALIALPFYVPPILLAMAALTGEQPALMLSLLGALSLLNIAILTLAVQYILRDAVAA